MILSKNLSKAFNEQVEAEMWSSNLYLSMSIYFQKAGLNGCAHWMRKQAEEEMEHAHKMIDFAIDRGGDIVINQINVVPTAWGTPLEVFEHVYKHEVHVSELIDQDGRYCRSRQRSCSQRLFIRFRSRTGRRRIDSKSNRRQVEAVRRTSCHPSGS